MADPGAKRPQLDDTAGMWPSTSANSFRQQYLAPGHLQGSRNPEEPLNTEPVQSATPAQSSISHEIFSSDPEARGQVSHASSEQTQVPSTSSSQPKLAAPAAGGEAIDHEVDEEEEEDPSVAEEGGFAPIKTSATKDTTSRPSLYQQLTRRQTGKSSILTPQISPSAEEHVEIERLLSRMFG